MATQERYRDYKAPVSSKNSMEPFGLINGIGPVFGFDRATYNSASNTLVISSNNDDDATQGSQTQVRYSTTEGMALQQPSHGVITPDAILTVLTGALSVNVNGTMGTHKEILVIATHNYQASEVTNATTFIGYANATSTSWTNMISYKDGVSSGENYGDIRDWFRVADIAGNLEKNKSVIIGLYTVMSSSNSLVSVKIPYFYKWPAQAELTQEQWEFWYNQISQNSQNINELTNTLNDRFTELQNDLNTSLTIVRNNTVTRTWTASCGELTGVVSRALTVMDESYALMSDLQPGISTPGTYRGRRIGITLFKFGSDAIYLAINENWADNFSQDRTLAVGEYISISLDINFPRVVTSGYLPPIQSTEYNTIADFEMNVNQTLSVGSQTSSFIMNRQDISYEAGDGSSNYFRLRVTARATCIKAVTITNGIQVEITGHVILTKPNLISKNLQIIT